MTPEKIVLNAVIAAARLGLSETTVYGTTKAEPDFSKVHKELA